MLARRPARLQRFLDHTEKAIGSRVRLGSPAALAMRAVHAALVQPRPRPISVAPRQMPACRHLPAALAVARQGPPDVVRLVEAFAELAPSIAWRRRPSDDPVFTEGHASAWIVGPGPEAIERRDDVIVGASLVAPGITFPDHRHPPEEVYIVLSGGDWRQDDDPWHTPGRGGIVYNPPDIVHAMRAGAEPLLAIWCLPVAVRPDPTGPTPRSSTP